MKHSFVFAAALLGLLFFGSAAVADDTCKVAADIAQKARQAFETDREQGLKLFIKAEALCDQPVYDYNLAMAYWRFGASQEAIDRLSGAVAAKSEPLWQNNLAQMMISAGKDPATVLSLAAAAAREAPATPVFAATLADAELYNGDYAGALEQIVKADAKWPREKKIAEKKETIVQAYLVRHLEMIKAGRTREGVSGLASAADSHPAIARAHAVALVNSGQTDPALQAAAKAEKAFSGNKEVAGLFDEVMKRAAGKLYEAFTANPAAAVSQAKAFAETWPQSKVAKTAYDELFNAYLADTATIAVPDAVAVKPSAGSGATDADALMAELFDKGGEVKTDLTVDVEQDIPAGRAARTWAVAVVVGNQRYGRYQKGINDVRYAERDAAVMKQYLVKTMGFQEKNIIYRLNTTSGDMRDIFGTPANPGGQLSRFVRSETKDLFVYYSGHGAPGPDGKSAFLVPVDASADFIANNGYPLDQFYRIIDGLKVANTTVVLESCFSGDSAAGALFDNISPVLVKNMRPLPDQVNAAVFCSADKDQVATWYPDKRHGLFTYFFFKAMSGGADANRDKTVTIGEMADYLKKEVPYWAGRTSNRTQNPLVHGDLKRVLVDLK
ncbi:MAG: caspase family protein [Thermodesulfobacteriota bacterium]|nr:caspase family protein [Thermodesulfobacteriota bacterium]